ncbi:B-cell lymphoma/leukemia 11A isoform X2 [Parasteatoda tepidariorum]|uniref:B-cell lymphoma/leukemia 11A isoform X2 n=1 Tax=Parasteatoda tepidariorum TaxID=114398 RepID=UPI00077F8F9A|nr:B-cell lymphoma/leukemia 11A isoform X2 [Parasteatoda tepidariorum]
MKVEAELLQDTLTCGSCQKVFVLSEIVKFIQHKVNSCNKENNFIILEDEGPVDFDSDREDNPPQSLVSGSKAPSISAPICNRKGLHHQHHHLHRSRNRAEKNLALPNSPSNYRFGERGPQENRTNIFKKEIEDGKTMLKLEPGTNDEAKDLSLRSSPKVMVNAYTNTIITEPSTYTCSTCKQTFTSAWVLVQHAQHMHGMKIYLVTPYHGSRNSSSSSVQPTGPPPSLINSSSSLGIPLPPVLPPCSTMNGPSHHHNAHHHNVLPQQALSLENHPALQLLRMPLGERQFPPTSLNPPNIFARPSSQDFRVDILATSSSTSGNSNNPDGNQQFHRLNHHQPHPPPHSAPSLPGLGIGNFEPHNPFIDRGPLGIDTRHRPPPMSLGFEPQMDFYSQRLRQLAGATSPTTVAASPRKLTPPFTHPTMSSSSQPSTPTSTPQPALNLHNSSSGNITPAPSHQHNNNQAHSGSSASSTSSKGGGATDAADGSPKLLKSWSCEFCGKAFRFQSSLTVHRRSHTGEKPYKCLICKHTCSQASKLKRHMKTHQGSNGKMTNASENNSLESPRSTPDSTSETGKERDRQVGRSLDDEEDASDGQTADNEEDEEDLDDEDEEEEDELDDEEDLDDSNEIMMAEDLSTRGPSNSTPIPRESPSSEQNKTSKPSTVDITTNNDNSSNTISVSNGENGSNSRDKENSKPEPRHSLLSEVMDKIGLSNIQQYNEAYQKALEESSLKNSLKDDTEISSQKRNFATENGPERLNNKEDGNNNINSHGGSNKSMPLPPHSMDFGHSIFGAFDYHHHHHNNTFEATKRLKLDFTDHIRNSNDRDPLYAGLWLPSVHGSSSREIYDTEYSRHIKSSSSESALKSVTPTNMSSRSMSPRPGTSGGGASVTPIPGILVNSSKSGASTKEQRRNDTCEYCGKVFKNCSNLTVHRRSHTGEKPYKCELCSYACAQSSKLTRHMKTHGRLGKDVYRCRFCDMPFSVPSTLEKHMRKCVVNQNATGVTYMDRDSDSKDLT